MKVLTGIDLPLRMSCGSMVLAADIYGRAELPFDANFLCLDPVQDQPIPPNWTCLPLDKSLCLRNADAYHGRLSALVESEAARYRPDILHCQHLGYSMSKALVGCAGVPKIGLCHGTDVIEAMNSEAGRRDFQFLVDCMDRIVFPSRGILNDARRIASIAEERASIIPWGIPDSYLLPKDRRPTYAASPFRILYAGRLDASKGIPTLLQAMTALPDNVHLTILGEGPEEAAVRDMIAELAIGHRTELQRWRTRSELQRTFLDFQLLVLPSRRIEAFGLVSVEAQAAGLPVLVANVSGLPETLPFQAQELAFEAGNAVVLAEKIARIEESEHTWQHYSDLCRSNAGRFVISDCVKQLDELSREVLDEAASAKHRGTSISVADSAFYDAAFLQRYDALQGAVAEVKAAEQRILDEIVDARQQSRLPCERYLDVGTCTGRYLIWAYHKGFQTLCGLDHSPDAIAHCRTKLIFPARLIEGSCLNMESYRGIGNLDLVTMMMGTANHLTGPELKTFLLTVSNVIATGGDLVLSTWRSSPQRLMLYTEADAGTLCEIPLNLAELQPTGAPLTIINRVATSWHDLWVLRKA